MSRHVVLMVPGWGDSGPRHWQSLWQQRHPEYRRMAPRDWFYAVRDDWMLAIEAAIRDAAAPIVIAAHSLGCHAVTQCAARRSAIAGALLVAPPDIERADFPPVAEGFTPISTQRLSFPSIVVASRDDPYTTIERAREFAERWGSRFVDAGACGHINADAGFGPWPEGERLLEELIHG